MRFETKQGDTRNAIKATLTPAQGDLSDLSQVRFCMADTLFHNVMDRAVDVWNAPEAIVVFVPSEVANDGSYVGEFVVTYTDGKIETFPNVGYIDIRINKNLG